MIRSTRTLLLFSAWLITSASAFTAEQIDTDIGLDNVFVPKGFDSNDNVEIVVSGELPNTCYLRPRGEAKIVNNRVVVEMKATKINDSNVVCIMAVVPYMVSVPLGRLEEGSYNILVNAGASSETNSTIAIEHPNSNSINNYTYANVTNIESLTLERNVVITGVHPSSCMEIDRVEIVPNETNDTYSVLPIIKQSQPICDRMLKPFTHTIHLPPSTKNAELLHVRKIDGTALNYIVHENGKK